MEMICSKTGLKYDGSPRSKNHPMVSKILTNSRNAYRSVLEACEIVKEQQMSESDAIKFLEQISNETNEQKVKESLERSRNFKEWYKESQKNFKPTPRLTEEEEYLEDINYKSNFIEPNIEM